MNCHFCVLYDHESSSIREETSYWYVVRDNFPVTKGHTLIVTKRHVPTFFDLFQDEYNELLGILCDRKQMLEGSDPSIMGFNVGMNCGIVAGQTIMHCHVHLIPRREGDVPDPRGGIRNVIPGKGNYEL